MTREEMVERTRDLGENDMCPVCHNRSMLPCCTNPDCIRCDGEDAVMCPCQD
jgi:hypothetical protein